MKDILRKQFCINHAMDTISQGKEFTADQINELVTIFDLAPEQATHLFFGKPITMTEEIILQRFHGKNFNLVSAYYAFRKQFKRDPNELELLILYWFRDLEMKRTIFQNPVANCTI